MVVVVVVVVGGGSETVGGVATGAFLCNETGCGAGRAASRAGAGWTTRSREGSRRSAARCRLDGRRLVGACTTVRVPVPEDSATPTRPLCPERRRGMSAAPATAAASRSAAIPRSIPLMSPALLADNIPRTGHRQEGSPT